MCNAKSTNMMNSMCFILLFFYIFKFFSTLLILSKFSNVMHYILYNI